MRNQNCAFSFGNLLEILKYPMLCYRVQGGRRFIQQNNRRVSEKGSGQCHTLPLSAGQFFSILRKPTSHILVDTLFPIRCKIRHSALNTSLADSFCIFYAVKIGQSDIFAQSKTLRDSLLKQGSEQGTQFIQPIFPDVHSVYQNLAIACIVEPA